METCSTTTCCLLRFNSSLKETTPFPGFRHAKRYFKKGASQCNKPIWHAKTLYIALDCQAYSWKPAVTKTNNMGLLSFLYVSLIALLLQYLVSVLSSHIHTFINKVCLGQPQILRAGPGQSVKMKRSIPELQGHGAQFSREMKCHGTWGRSTSLPDCAHAIAHHLLPLPAAVPLIGGGATVSLMSCISLWASYFQKLFFSGLIDFIQISVDVWIPEDN